MYMDVATMTFEQVSRLSSLLSQARLASYLRNVNGKTYLIAVDRKEYDSIFEPAFSFDYI